MGFFRDLFTEKDQPEQADTYENIVFDTPVEVVPADPSKDWYQLQYRNDDGTWTNTDTQEMDKVYRMVEFKNGVYSFSEPEAL